ncbi:glycoside hydrolase family protein [uncultured Sunxiuqinia sp.]|uniref:glycoside hydrolase family protein n=1 Tax=uncultured Sunxiuqinia sp. TaxID=1573825 RepID=UPI0026183E56|nr:glycoside hydrolase family protein [uncultured Sunxiuqinia sp.]
MKNRILTTLLTLLFSIQLWAQIIERERPKEWGNLIEGGRFIDRFQAIPIIGELTDETWGADDVIPRYVDNGIEEKEWSYWGGNILVGDDDKFHLFVCRWPENAKKGHMEWPRSEVVHAVCENSFGPFQVKEVIGKGHNPEIYRLKNGGYVLYVYQGYYYSDKIDGPWEYHQFEFNARNRKIPDGLSNLTFAQREDGSYIMLCRGGSIWFSEDGLSGYNLVSENSIYPPYKGEYEDPVMWKTNIQYHAIVHDWKGRIAYYMRSKDGINWKLDPGEAYETGIAIYEDGTKVDWYKYERIKMLQDKYGRAVQANFAVIDTIKWDDLGGDNHSSKNIGIPLTYGRLLTILNKEPIDATTKSIKVKVEAEKGFNPHKDIDLISLRFGAPEEVNFGKGCKLLDSEKEGNDLVLTFEGTGNGITEDNFTAKLIGQTTKGKLLFGYARLPGVDYLQAALSACLPKINSGENGSVEIEVQNFGQVESEKSGLKIEVKTEGNWKRFAYTEIEPLKSFEKRIVRVKKPIDYAKNECLDVRVVILQPGQREVSLTGQLTVK